MKHHIILVLLIALTTLSACDRPDPEPKLAAAMGPCYEHSDCASGFCSFMHTCCAEKCEGGCDWCPIEEQGRCVHAPKGSYLGNCPFELPSQCSYNGTCDGQGGCAKYAPGSPCGGQSGVSYDMTCHADGACY